MWFKRDTRKNKIDKITVVWTHENQRARRGTEFILCTKCKNWCHKRCSGLKRLVGLQNFQCPECKKRQSERGGEMKQHWEDRLRRCRNSDT